MDKLFEKLKEIKQINEIYNLSNEDVESLAEEMKTAKVCIPFIGKFSSGKSALINTILGYRKRKLKENITPETAIPVEITYNEEDCVVLVSKNDKGEIINDKEEVTKDIDDYVSGEWMADDISHVRMNLCNNFLSEIKDIAIVDMPGFDSGYEAHNLSIDNYIAKSLAYIIVVSSDEMTLKSNIANVLKDLNINNMPFAIAITKCDKVHKDDMQIVADKLKDQTEKLIQDIKKHIKADDIQIYYTSGNVELANAESIKKYLRKIQEQSNMLLENKYKKRIIKITEIIESYIQSSIKSIGLSESEIEEKEDKLELEMQRLHEDIDKEEKTFSIQINNIVKEIKNDLQISLSANINKLVTMLMNNQDIKEQVNTIVRNSVTKSIQERLIPKIDRHLKKINDIVNTDDLVNIGFLGSSVALVDTGDITKTLIAPILIAITGVVMSIPILGSIVAAITFIVSTIINSTNSNKKREESKNKIRSQLESEVFPQIIKEVGEKLETEINVKIDEINKKVEKEILQRKNILQKSVDDLKEQKKKEQENTQNRILLLEDNLKRIEGIKYELQ